MKKKILSLTLVVCLLAIAVVGGTLAYFVDQTQVTTNTFSVGNVDITLTEEDVDLYGDPTEKGRITDGNEYKLIPGHTYLKDPTVVVENPSEEAYVRMLVTVTGLDALKGVFPEYEKDGMFLLQELALDKDGKNTWSADWECVKVAGNVYEFRYDGEKAENGVVDARNGKVELPALFEYFTVPGNLAYEDVVKLDNVEIAVKAQAIQADGFDNADEAWLAFDAQVNE